MKAGFGKTKDEKGFSSVYFLRSHGSPRVTVGIKGPRGGQGGSAWVYVEDLLDALITAIGPLAVTTAIAKHKNTRTKSK